MNAGGGTNQNLTSGHAPLGQLGRYPLVREIARSNDIVWEGVDPKMNRRVAVKELSLPPNLVGAGRRERIDRFYREARAAGAMNQANIVTIYEVGEDRGRYFIAMEYLEGQTLRDKMRVGGPMPLNEAVRIASSLADALEYAHARGVIHRDIKPDNIHILPSGQVKLTDFGIARITGEEQLTVAGQVFGTPSYMSPEQVLGNPIDVRSDLFSLGILLYEMVAGKKPFTGDSVVTITYHILHDPLPALPFGTPPALEQVLHTATAKAPDHRYRSAADFRMALQAAAATQLSGRTGNFAAAPTPAYPNNSYQQNNPYQNAPQMTAQYGAQTQMGVAPGYANAPAMPQPGMMPGAPVAQVYPVPPQNHDANQRLFTAAAVFLVVITLIAAGGYALSRAFHNYNGMAGYTQGSDDFKRASELYNAGDYENAAAAFKKIRQSGTANGETQSNATNGELYCYRQLGHQAQARSDWAAAQRWYEAALTVSPGDKQAQTELDTVRNYRNSNAPAPPLPPDTTPQTTQEFPSAPAPGTPNVNANDFNSANAKAAAEALAWFQKGEAARLKGDDAAALRNYTAAVAAGPGSPGASQAQQRITGYNTQHNPLDYGN